VRVIGTAGHVDHGKSTLVAALTGTHPDRLKEEQEREMTIDLGFGWVTLPAGETIGIIDVPGHRDFIENMLAGVGGVDAALFVIAADEGVMPQTREHLAILDLLNIDAGVGALTKVDLVAGDREWIEMVSSEIHDVLSGTVLAEAPIIPVSARTGEGIPELLKEIEKCLAGRAERPDLGRPRLPIDRVFTMPGFGTVVTGTLLDGEFSIGEEVKIYPTEFRGRIRGLQTHRKKVDIALPGSRTAINISGVNVENIQRGHVVAHPGKYQPTRLIDASFRLLKDISGNLRHNSEVKFFTGSSEVLARLRLLGVDELEKGNSGWLQIDLKEPVIAVRGDRFILRRPSPAETLGGGVIVDPHPSGRHKRFDPDIIRRLESLQQGTPGDILTQVMVSVGIAPFREIAGKSGLPQSQIREGIEDLQHSGVIERLEDGNLSSESDVLVCTTHHWKRETLRLVSELTTYHQLYPLRRGIPKEELKSRLKISARYLNTQLNRWVKDGIIIDLGTHVALSGFSVRFTEAQKELAKTLLSRFSQNPFEPPSVKDCQAEIGTELYQALLDQGELIQVSSEVVFRKSDYSTMLKLLEQHFQMHDTIAVAEFRDLLKSSRRYILAFLEHLDGIGLTMRDGDVRRMRKAGKNKNSQVGGNNG